MPATDIDATYIRRAIKDGYTHVVTNDRLDGRQEVVSLHHSYEAARKALVQGRGSKRGNAIYELADFTPDNGAAE
jgi:hypothetical protein